MSKHQTDNSYLAEKISLRIESLCKFGKEDINVLECFAGDGYIWEACKKNSTKKINVLRIDKKEDKKGIYLKGDNQKFISAINLSNFNIIDLDAYGSPFTMLEYIFKSNYKGCIHCTYINSVIGRINNKMLNILGFSNQMIKKCPTLFSKHPLEKMLFYLNKRGVEDITGYFMERKNYFYFFIS
jgi:hypothetical protein